MGIWREKFDLHATSVALVCGDTDQSITYRELAGQTARWVEYCLSKGIRAGSVVAFPAIYNLEFVSLFFALSELGAIIVPLPSNSPEEHEKLLAIASVTHLCVGNHIDPISVAAASVNGLYRQLALSGHAGLVLFTSGTTGQPKAAVHDIQSLCSRYSSPRPCARMLVFMQLDHIGGVNTLLFIASNGGTMVSPSSNTPSDVCAAIAKYSVQVLPTSPTFLNLMLISGCLEKFDLSSLERITYGSEPMPSSLLQRINQAAPNVTFLQTYGTTEIGILKSQSRSNGSLWMKVGGEGFDVKIVDGRLWVSSPIAMLGYLNAPSPFDSNGFMDTGDRVEEDGDWIRIIGRVSETINVGGLKVSPVEVESVLLTMPGVLEAAVCGEANALIGQVVTATVRLASDQETLKEFKARMRVFCKSALPPQAIPSRVTLTTCELVTSRFKRARHA